MLRRVFFCRISNRPIARPGPALLEFSAFEARKSREGAVQVSFTFERVPVHFISWCSVKMFVRYSVPGAATQVRIRLNGKFERLNVLGIACQEPFDCL